MDIRVTVEWEQTGTDEEYNSDNDNGDIAATEM